MKIGDLVVRAYSWHILDIGIVVDEYTCPQSEEFDEFFVLWGVGNITREMPVELDFIEDLYEDLKVVYDL